MTTRIPRGWFFLLFTVSGFAGLIYESIWSHYLKLFLGHAAYAQTLVLAIFMGGMALGSWLCSRHSIRWRNLLLGYAVTEAAIGLCALVFHRAFVGATGFAYDSIMPVLGSPLAVSAFKWALSAALILPQSVLLGMTFPLMSGGLIRAYPDRGGATIATLYFTNSLGAAAGVLASGFALVAWVGLPGTLLTAGVINIVLALIVWLLSKDMAYSQPPPRQRQDGGQSGRRYILMLGIAALTGAASFIYEIGWIRMLSMVLGSSTHAFELMLSAFILGLAFGGLWIKRSIDRTDNPERLLGIVQVVMGLLALSTLLMYGHTFELMRWLIGALARTESGYVAFNVGSHVIALSVMFPAAFCAGMTLPLITHALIKQGAGERAIGAVYAANTVGAIAGVVFAVHVGLPWLGLKGSIVAGGAIDIGLGLVLLFFVSNGRRLAACATAAGVTAIVATLAWVQLDPYKMASGVYRHGGWLAREKGEILFHRDGKTATVDLVKAPARVSIRTNGKSDAALNLDPGGMHAPDETTMVLTAALALALNPQARSAANIGFGSGLTSHVLLASDTLTEVDTIEIEPVMVDAARGFSPRNDFVYRDARSRIHIEDAKTFFSTHNKRYDIIASEPSNPWVSGVASLFTDEFYQRIRRHLNEQGVFVQWVQIYEISPALVASIFKALTRHFSDYTVYAPNDIDIVIVARNGAGLPPPSGTLFTQPRLARELERIGVRTAADIELHQIGNKLTLQPYFDRFDIAANSDFFPVLDLNASKARYLAADASDVVNLARTPIPALEILGAAPRRGEINSAPRPWFKKAGETMAGLAARDYLLHGGADRLARIPAANRADFERVRTQSIECLQPRRPVTVANLFAVSSAMTPVLSRDEIAGPWRRISAAPCASSLGERERSWIALFAAIGARDSAGMAQWAERLLRTDAPYPDFLLGAAVTARLARNEREQAAALWREFADQAVSQPGNMLPDLLTGHLWSKQGASRSLMPVGSGK